VIHRPQHPAFQDDAPYNVAIVELEEGIRLHGNVVGIAGTKPGRRPRGRSDLRSRGRTTPSLPKFRSALGL
jgi:uncharacterized OB-fold protein